MKTWQVNILILTSLLQLAIQGEGSSRDELTPSARYLSDSQSQQSSGGGVMYGRSRVPSTDKRRKKNKKKQDSSSSSSSSSYSSSSSSYSSSDHGRGGGGGHDEEMSGGYPGSSNDFGVGSYDSSYTNSYGHPVNHKTSSSSSSFNSYDDKKSQEGGSHIENSDVVDQSYFLQRKGKDEDGHDLFRWTGKEYTGVPGASRISKTKTSRKTTKISTTKISSIGPDGKVRYTYSYPGGNRTTFLNTTSYTAHVPESSGNEEQRRYESSSFDSSRGTSGAETSSTYDSSSYGTSYGGRGASSSATSESDRRSNTNVGFGKNYHKNTESGISDGYEVFDEYDQDFMRGHVLIGEDGIHPYVLRGIATSPGNEIHPSHCQHKACQPEMGNLLIGRADRLTATSTCGLYHREKYCIVSNLEKKERNSCFMCDSTERQKETIKYSHRINNVIHRFDPSTRRRTWWQSENGKEMVSIQLNLEAEFHFTHLVLKFKTFRPAVMLIERSSDNGKTWKIYRYFAYNCAEVFPNIPQGPSKAIDQVVCESRYSKVEPSSFGEVVFRVLPPNVAIDNPYHENVQDILKVTNIRINFTRLHTLGDQLLDTRHEIKEKYYYAVYDISAYGSCSCNGHAPRCLPLPNVRDVPGMIHGRCECIHNTKGENCQMCQDFYNDFPWKPAVWAESNPCKKCNCNNHASNCHFDPKVYEDSGTTSGGVCDDCAHFTQGHNCQECILNYYQDPQRDLHDIDICQPCYCDQRGSINDAICDSRTDADNGLMAGRCHCKDNVNGLKCDRCKPGYWNFTSENPVGCQECTCDIKGTVNNAGCDVISGECSCKRFVTGRDCNQCFPQHFGLSEHPDGCEACNCDKGGSYDNDCDVINGQCKCRPHVLGRQCDQPEEGYYVATLNYLTYEAELARGSELYCEEASLYGYRQNSRSNCQVVPREPYRDGRESHWTGIGFMRVFDGSYLEFEIENIETSMEYDLVIQYEPQFRGQWENVVVTIERPEPVDPSGRCSNSRPVDDRMTIPFHDNRRQVTLFPPVCLEEGKRYKVRIDFRRSNSHTQSPSSSILIDSLMLIPRADQLPFYSGSLENDNLRQEYNHYRCSEAFYSGHNFESIPDICKSNHLYSLGFYVYKQAFSCQCDATGSRSKICHTFGGQCDCKTNVVGRRCGRCAPGTYGFGPEGCQTCDCSAVGALDNFCDQQSGQCKCRPNTYGRQCNECQPGYWDFPNCRRCECNGHADTCDSFSGACHECRDETTGHNCAICIEGHYGDPRLEIGIACRPCPCPGIAGSGHSFAERCALDPHTKDVFCECKEGYTGSRCDSCADNYFGDPEVPGGKCESCDCSNNIDISTPGNCDARTGECLQCLYSTSGNHCERCADGFYGDSFNQQCRECVCNILGTDTSEGPCNHENGQCLCYPHVLGKECDHCQVNHWKIASGSGCEDCDCDSTGSYSDQCNEFDGQCSCRQGFGGRRCNQCQTNFFGNPRVECLTCDCNYDGSETLQCNHESGQCICRPGIGGFKCDECARGYTGRAPSCQPCGECFDNWDFVLMELKNRTKALIDSAGQIKQSGATGAYSHEFESMEEKIQDVRNILLTSNLTSQNLETLDVLINQLRINLTSKGLELQTLESNVDNTTQRIDLASNALAELRLQAEDLRNQAGDLKAKATKLQEANVEGALNLTRLAGARSEAAKERVDLTQVTVSQSDRNRRRTENRLLHVGDRFNRTQIENDNNLADLSINLDMMESKMPDLNDQVCDRRGDPCNTYCGGAGCAKCGGLSCADGLVNTAELALDFAQDAEESLKKKESEADTLLRGISGAKRLSDQAGIDAQMAFDMTLMIRNKTSIYKLQITTLLREIEEYFSTKAAKPSEIRTLAETTLDLNIKLRPEQITKLAEKITLTIDSLTNIDAIIDATKNDLGLADRLKARADRAKAQAGKTLSVAERVVKALNEAEMAQEAAEEAINQANSDISATEVHLTQIASETSAAQKKAEDSLIDVGILESRMMKVQSSYKINQRHMELTRAAVDKATLKAQRATNERVELEDKYVNIVTQLEENSKAATEARKRADDLKKRANKLASEADAKLGILREMEAVFRINEDKLLDYEEIIRRMEIMMEEYHSYILTKTKIYTTCSSGRR